MLFQVFINKITNLVRDVERVEPHEKFANIFCNPLRKLFTRKLHGFLSQGGHRALGGKKNNGGEKFPSHQIQVAQPLFDRSHPFIERIFRHGISISNATGQPSVNMIRSELERLEKRGLEVKG